MEIKINEIKAPSIYSTPEELAAWTEWYMEQVTLANQQAKQ